MHTESLAYTEWLCFCPNKGHICAETSFVWIGLQWLSYPSSIVSSAVMANERESLQFHVQLTLM